MHEDPRPLHLLIRGMSIVLIAMTPPGQTTGGEPPGATMSAGSA
jgi:hypothetical protein